MQAAGARQRNRVRIERRSSYRQDGIGNTVSEFWETAVTVWGVWRPKFGREEMADGQVESAAQGVLTVLAFSATMAITADCRVTFVVGPYRARVFGIQSITPTVDGREIEFLLTERDV